MLPTLDNNKKKGWQDWGDGKQLTSGMIIKEKGVKNKKSFNCVNCAS